MADDQFTTNIRAVADLIESDTNKTGSGTFGDPEGASGEKMDVLDLPMSDEELLDLRDDWMKKFQPYETKTKETGKRNLRSYLGLTKDDRWPDDDTPVAANLQFESEETFLPAATAQDPAPFVFSDDTPEGIALADDVQTMLEFHAQQLLIRRKLAVMVRHWSIWHLAVIKAGWHKDINDVSLENRKIKDFVFDPEGYVDVYGEFNSWLGERIYVTAEKLVELFPKHKEEIKILVENKMGTECCYTEWWNDDYCFTTFNIGHESIVLDKHKNEYFNYPKPLEGDFRDEEDKPVMSKPRNHFAIPKKPFIFLSVFSLQERPHDITGLIEQNIPNQNAISRLTQQFDFNIETSNNGYAFSENNFTQETAKQAANARRKGNPILVPSGGPIGEAILPLKAQDLPSAFFDMREVHVNDLRSSWGTQGIASQQQKPDETARGMVLNQGRDTSRIGGGIVDILEQSVAKSCFDWLVQLYMVFYDEPHFGAVMGMGKATEYVTLINSQIDRQLIVGVAPNSMKPKDEISKMNQATQLFEMKAIGPKTLLEAMDFPNADEAAGDGVLYAIDPQAYLQVNFPELAQKLQQLQAQAQQAQMAQQQQQAQMEAQSGQQQLQQKAQAGQQQLQQKEAAHQQQLQHGAESHAQKLKLEQEQASAKMASQTKGALPK